MIISQSFFFKAFFLFLIITYNLTVVLAIPHYFGNIFYFLILCILINCLLYFSFLKSQYFFNMFFSIFILLGFGFKFTLSLIFLNKSFSYQFSNPFYSDGGMLRILSQKLLQQNTCIPNDMNHFFTIEQTYKLPCINFEKIILNPTIYDNGLLFSIFGIFSILISMFLFEKIIKKFSIQNLNFNFITNHLYKKLRYFLFFILFCLTILIGTVNNEFSIFKKGLTANESFFPLLRPLISWFLLFGLSSCICILLYFEFLKKTKIFNLFFLLSFFEPFFSSVSMMSRGFIFNASSIFFGYLKLIKKINFYYLIIILIFIISLFLLSIKSTQSQRSNSFVDNNIDNPIVTDTNNTKVNFFNLSIESSKVNFIAQVVIERWVGLEEVILTLNSKKIGWEFLKNSFKEKQSDNKVPLFDKEIYKEYVNLDRMKNNFVSIPGIIAFASFSNNIIFVFFFVSFVTFFCLIIELLILKISANNLFLSALISQIIAYRLIHFGVYPIETYKILLGICLTSLIAFCSTKIFLVKT